MQLMNEKQRFPFTLACIMALLIIGSCFLLTHLVDPAPAHANQLYWYVVRAAGFTTYGLLSVAVLLGSSSAIGIWDKWNMRKLMTQMHQYASLLVFPFLFFHLWGLYMDKSVLFHLLDLLVPFIDKYRAVPTGLGILTVYAWLLLVLSSYFREKIGVKLWMTIHYISFPMFIGVTLHGLLSGTDSAKGWALLVYLIPTVLFVILLFIRVRRTKKKDAIPAP